MDVDNLFFNTSDYQKTNTLIGRGSFGNVYIIKKKGKQYAIKILKDNVDFNGTNQKNFIRESLILHRLKHPLVIKLKGINLKSYGDLPSIITEYVPNGSLGDYIEGKKKNECKFLTTTQKYIMLLGIADAMRYIHEQGFIHRDLKADNVLIDENFYPRIADLGLAKCFDESLTMTTSLGTPLYMAPELQNDDINHYGPEVDVFSFAILMFEIVTGKMAYSELFTKKRSFSQINFLMKVAGGYRPQIPQNMFSQKLINLMKKCWSQNPSDRPSFAEIFTLLSSDFSYFDDEIDSEKVNQFLEMLKKNKEKESIPDKKDSVQARIDQLEEENKRLRTELSQIKQKSKIFSDPSINPLVAEASFFSAIDSLHGDPQKRSVEKVTHLLEESSNNGNSYASYLLGILNEGGYDGFEQDPTKAINFYEKSAEQGNSYAINRIGYCYEHGNGGVEVNLAKAIEYYRRGIEQNNPFSFDNMGKFYYSGIGVEQNYSEANKYFQKGTDIGYRSSICNLANSYLKGTGIKQDYNKAIELYNKAADLGSPNAYYLLGNCYAFAKGVKQNSEKAIQMYQKAADLGLNPSFNQLGYIYFNGIGVPKNYEIANSYYRKGAEKGVPTSMVNLGYSYENGLGVKQDFNEAIKWYKMAGEKKYAVGFYSLGLMYEQGKISDDTDAKNEAIKWYKKAADLGFNDAKLKLEKLK